MYKYLFWLTPALRKTGSVKYAELNLFEARILYYFL